MFNISKPPSNNDKLIDLDTYFDNKKGSIDFVVYQREDGTMYERFGSQSEFIREVSSDQMTDVQKLEYLKTNREEYLKQVGCLQYAMLVDQLESTKRISNE